MDAAAILSNRWRAAKQIWAQWQFLLLSLAILLLLTAALSNGYQRYLAWQKQQKLQGAHVTVQAVAANLGSRLQRVWSFTPRLSKSKHAVTLLSIDNPKARATWEALMCEQYPQVRVARLLPLGMRKVDYSSSPPLSYAALDMVLQAERQPQPAPPPTILLSGADQHIAIVHSITDQTGKPLGHLFLALDMSLLKSTLGSFPFPAGYWEVRQPVGEGGARILHTTGIRPLHDSDALVQANIPATGWVIAYWDPYLSPSETALASHTYIWSTALGIALLLIYYAVSRQRRSRNVRRNASQIRQAQYPPATQQARETRSSADRGQLMSAEKGLALDVIEPTAGAHTTMQQRGLDGANASATAKSPALPASIFRAYDVRGRVGETLTPEIVKLLGRAIGSEAIDRGQGAQTMVVGHDARLSSPSLCEALIAGLVATGCDVVNIGQVPTPVVYFATHYLQTGNGVVVTASHNPPDYNGLKIMLGGQILSGSQIDHLRERIEANDFRQGEGEVQVMEVVDEYVRAVADDIPVALGNAFQIVVDCGNSVAGDLAPKLYRALGHDVVELHCQVDGQFPHHHPDPSQPENLQELIETVRETGADLGLAFDGDGDRLGVIDGKGAIIWPDRQMMMFAKDILSRSPGAAIVYDVKCSNHLKQVIQQSGGQPIIWKSGHSYIRKKMQESSAPLAGELTGHIFFGDRWYGFDDAFYAGARMLELLIASSEAPHQVFSKLPQAYSTPELRIDLTEHEPEAFMERLMATDRVLDAEVEKLDGLRVTYPDGWGLVRASNTTPSLVMRFEGDTQDALQRVQKIFKHLMLEIDPKLAIPF